MKYDKEEMKTELNQDEDQKYFDKLYQIAKDENICINQVCNDGNCNDCDIRKQCESETENIIKT